MAAHTGGRPMIVDGVEISRHYITYIEGELRLYPARKRRLAWLETCIATATPSREDGMPGAPGPGDPTHSRALALMRDQERAYLQGWCRLVEDTYHSLSIEQQSIIRMMYWERRLTPDGVAKELGMHRSTMFRQRNRALLAFAIAMIGDHVATKMRLSPALPIAK